MQMDKAGRHSPSLTFCQCKVTAILNVIKKIYVVFRANV